MSKKRKLDHKKQPAATVTFLALLLLLITAAVAATRQDKSQDKPQSNPYAGDAQAIAKGRDLFLLSCAYCHGVDARGAGRGPDLTTGRWLHGEKDAEMFHTVSIGVPGTDMPACGCAEEDAWKLVSFVRSLSSNTGARVVAGDRAAGEKIFQEQACAACHVVNNRGGRFGPDLSRIGAARSTRNLSESIREPDKVIIPGYEGVTVVTKNGARIAGVRKNEDTFSVQLMDQAEKYHLYLKRDLREVEHEKRSLMPVYPAGALGEKDLQDLLAYLDSLRGQQKGDGSLRPEPTVIR